MRIGRPPAWQVYPSTTLLEALSVDQRGRCSLSARLRDRLDWIQPGLEVLAVLEAGGRVRLLPWERAESVRARLEALTKSLSGPDASSAAEGLILLQDRYQRLALDKTSRLELPPHICAHLDAVGRGVIFAVRLPDHLELWSERFRERQLVEAERVAEDLP